MKNFRSACSAENIQGAWKSAKCRSPPGRRSRVTSLERNLIDAAVRPGYAGGVASVLDAYRRAREASPYPGSVAYLRKLNHIYPYHQAIGFYMERAGFPAKQLAPLKALGTKWDFYLAHSIRNPAFNRQWRIHHPKGL